MRELKPEELRKTIDPNSLGINTTNDVITDDEEFVIIGQDNALKAIEIAMASDDTVHSNIYVAGDEDIGKTTVVKYFLKQNGAEDRPTPDDLCYVYNLDNPEMPLAIFLPAGQGKDLEKDMKEFWEKFIENLRQDVTSYSYKQIIDEISKDAEQIIDNLWRTLTEEAKKRNLRIEETMNGIEIISLTEEAERDTDAIKDLRQKIIEATPKRNEAYAKIGAALALFNKVLFENILTSHLAVFNKYSNEKLKNILNRVKEFLMSNHAFFFMPEKLPMHFKVLFDCNLFVDRSKTKGMPIIQAFDCGYCSLMGYVPYESFSGEPDAKARNNAGLVTNLTLMKPGKLDEGNYGVIILRVNDLFSTYESSLVWQKIKEIIRSGQKGIESIKSLGLVIKTLEPEKVPFKAKIVLVGDYRQYQLLSRVDDQFRRLFQKKVELDNEIVFSEKAVNDYLKYIAIYSKKNNFLPLNSEAAARVIEYGLELNGDQRALSLKLNTIRELIREANIYAQKTGKKILELEDIEKFISFKKECSSLFEKRARKSIKDKIRKINIDGWAIGQINAIAVHSYVDNQFAMPSKIMANGFIGKDGVFSIDREVGLTGPIHDKAAYTLESYIKWQYGKNKEIPRSFTLSFEQNYGGIEGDSATLAEALVILSELANVPIDQGVIITGSMNSKGEAQAIGGVNIKILGAYLTCKENGLTGRQKFIMPESNEQELMVNKEVALAIAEDKFHIYSVEHINEVIEITTNMPIDEFKKKIYKAIACLRWERLEIKSKKNSKE